jgi:hypothetical protein
MDMIFPRKSGGKVAMMGASETAISFAFGGRMGTSTGGGETGRGAEAAGVATGVAAGGRLPMGRTLGAGGESIRCKMPRSRPANLDLTMLDMLIFLVSPGNFLRASGFKHESSHALQKRFLDLNVLRRDCRDFICLNLRPNNRLAARNADCLY